MLCRLPPDRQKLQLLFLPITKRYIANASRASPDRLIRQCYSILEVDPSCRDEIIIRKAYLEKVKQYHPDSSFQDNKGDSEKFNQVRQAYETLLGALKPADSSAPASTSTTDDIDIKFDIRHTAPQHRTHLEYGGFGMGTPSQRQTAYYKMRAQQAQERVYEYRRDRESVETREELVERKKRKDVRATNFIDRLVEDMIQESMSRGDFNNIRPSGKPLHERNPHYMDFTTYKINEILIDNGKVKPCESQILTLFKTFRGYMPEWILLEKQVRQSIDEARISLKRVFKAIATENPQPSDEQKTYLMDNTKWTEAVEKFRRNIADVNVDINKLNLVVPMLWRQQVHYNADKEIAKIIALDPLNIELPPSEEEIALMNRQELEQRHQEWTAHQASQRYSIGDAIRDFFEALRNFKV